MSQKSRSRKLLQGLTVFVIMFVMLYVVLSRVTSTDEVDA